METLRARLCAKMPVKREANGNVSLSQEDIEQDAKKGSILEIQEYANILGFRNFAPLNNSVQWSSIFENLAIAGKINKIDFLLNNGVKPSKQNLSAAFGSALWRRDMELIELLINQNNTLNPTGQDDYPRFTFQEGTVFGAFKELVRNNQLDIVRFIYSNTRPTFTQTMQRLIVLSSCTASLEMVKLVVEGGIYLPRSFHESGSGPLSIAISRRKPEIMEYLLEKGFPIKLDTECITQALKLGDLDLLKDLLERGAVSQYDEQDAYLILYSNIKSLNFREELVDYAIKIIGEYASGRDSRNSIDYITNLDDHDLDIRPLGLAIKLSPNAIIPLLNNGADPIKVMIDYYEDEREYIDCWSCATFYQNAQSLDKLLSYFGTNDPILMNRLIFDCINNDFTEAIAILRRYCVDLNVLHRETGYSPLTYAYTKLHTEILSWKGGMEKRVEVDDTMIRTLLENGANVNFVGNGEAPIYTEATKFKSKSFLAYLIEMGADCNLKVNGYNSAYEEVIKSGNEDLIRNLTSTSEDYSSNEGCVSRLSREFVIEYILKKPRILRIIVNHFRGDNDVFIISVERKTLLEIATEENLPKAIEILNKVLEK